jgi:hypothetical protein
LEIVPLTPTNLPLVNVQHGATLSLTYSSGKVRFNPFITVQETVAKDYTHYSTMPDAPPAFVQIDPTQYNIYSGLGSRQVFKGAPSVFGGFTAGYEMSEKLRLH